MVANVALVTGATGGLGQVLTSVLLAQGRSVIATGRNKEAGDLLERKGARFIRADLAEDDLTGLVVEADTVFHLAALSSPWGDYNDFVAANITATKRLLAAARQAQCRRFIFTSSPSIYTCAKHQIGLTEDSALPLNPVNAYAQTKLAAEQAVLASAAPDFQTVALRPRAIISPYDSVLLPRLLQAAKSGFLPLPGWGNALIEPTDARDVASALLAAEACAGEASGRVFNISGGHPVPLKSFVRYVFKKMNRKVRLMPVPSLLALGVASLMERVAMLSDAEVEPKLTRYSAMVLGYSQTFDLSRAARVLHWAPHYKAFDAIDWALEERFYAVD